MRPTSRYLNKIIGDMEFHSEENQRNRYHMCTIVEKTLTCFIGLLARAVTH